MLYSRWKVLTQESHLWYRDEIVAMSQVTVIFHKILVRMIADGDVVDMQSGDVGNILSEFYEQEDVI